MSDRELLELAAKAAGHEINANAQKERDEAGFGHRGLWISKPSICTAWNPLTDDGDALRLAVKLRLEIEYGQRAGRVYVGPGGDAPFSEMEYEGQDCCAATRRAIVRAAAEIGRAMP